MQGNRNEVAVERLSGLYILAHTTSITDFYLVSTYIARTIRPTLRALDSIASPVLLSFDGGGLHYYPVVVQMDPSGSGG